MTLPALAASQLIAVASRPTNNIQVNARFMPAIVSCTWGRANERSAERGGGGAGTSLQNTYPVVNTCVKA